MKLPLRLLGVIASALTCTANTIADPFPIIDTHTHINTLSSGSFGRGAAAGSTDFSAALSAAMDRMDKAGIQRGFFLPPPSAPGARNKYEIDALSFAIKKYPGRVSLIGGGGSINGMIHGTRADSVSQNDLENLRAMANAIADQSAIAFGEIAIHHLSLKIMTAQHPYESTAADHPLLRELMDIAATRNMPVDIHIDLVPEKMDRPNRPAVFNSTNPERFEANLPAFERLLAHNRNARVVWAHAGSDPLGTRGPRLQRELLARHPNLYMSIRVARGGAAPFFALDENLKLKPIWLELFTAYPDRFVIGSDHFHGPIGAPMRGPEENSLNNYRSMLDQIPTPVAEAIAFRNALKIYPLSN